MINKVFCICIISLLGMGIAFAQEAPAQEESPSQEASQENSGETIALPLEFTFLVSTGYQLGFDMNQGALDMAFASHDVLLGASGFFFSFAIQLQYSISEMAKFGLEVAIDLPLAGLINEDERPSSQVRGVSKLLPKAFFLIDFENFLALNILAGARVNSLTYTEENRTGTSVHFDLELRLLFEIIDSLDLYVGFNYILPIDIDADETGIVLNDADKRLFNLNTNALTPVFGVKILF